MKTFGLVFGFTLVFNLTAIAVDIAISTQANWWGQAAADREMQEIAENVTGASVEQFATADQAALARWVVNHTGNGVSDLLILCGQFPATIYDPGNGQADDSIAELFLDDGNTIINTGDYMFFVVNGTGINGAGGLQTMMDIPGITMWDDDTPVVVTSEGRAFTPSLENLQTDRPFHLDELRGDWYVELILAGNVTGTRADPVIVRNSSTGGRLGIFFQTASQDNNPRGEVISEWINNWYLKEEPISYRITNITATASSSQAADMGPENTVNGSGLNALDQHSTEATDMWLSALDAAPWIQYEFDKTYLLHEMWVWNSNQLIETFVGLGVKEVVVEYSPNGATWIMLEGGFQLARAPGQPTYTANTIVDFGGAMAKFVRLTIISGYGMLPQYGLSEVRFFFIPGSADIEDPSRVAWYTFDESKVCDDDNIIIDWSGYDNTGTPVGDLANIVIANDTGMGQVLSLPGGNNNFVDCGAVGISGNDPTTIACWAKADHTNIPDWTLIFGFTGTKTGAGGNGSHFNIGSIGGPQGIGAHVWGWEETILPDEETLDWHHYAMTYDGTTIQYYADGVLTDTDRGKSNVRDLSIRADRVHIGSRVTQASSFPGDVDDCVVYSNVLTEADITQVMLRMEDVTGPDDVVVGVPNDDDWPRAETPARAFDDNVNTKYLHFKGDELASGVRIAPAIGSSLVTGLTLTVANDCAGRDPIAFELYGSNEGIDGPYELIASGDLVDFAQADEWPRFAKNATPILFENSMMYKSYQVLFPAIRGPVGACVNSMQIAEIELLEPSVIAPNATIFPLTVVGKIEDFDSYGEDPNIFDVWRDGERDPDNGAEIGYRDSPDTNYLEQTIVHSGEQSLPFSYHGFSVATREYESTEDWTRGKPTILSLWFRPDHGSRCNDPAAIFLTVSDSRGRSATAYHPDPAATQKQGWTDWRIDLRQFTRQDVDLSAVKSFSIGVDDLRGDPPFMDRMIRLNSSSTGSSGKLFVDNIESKKGFGPVDWELIGWVKGTCNNRLKGATVTIGSFVTSTNPRGRYELGVNDLDANADLYVTISATDYNHLYPTVRIDSVNARRSFRLRPKHSNSTCQKYAR